MPARQRLEPHDAPAPQGDDGLVLHAQLAALDGPAQVVLQLQHGDRPVVHGHVEDGVLGDAQALGPVHGGVGVAQHVLGPDLQGPAAQRDADRGAGEHLLPVDLERHRQLALHALGDARRIGRVLHPFHQHGELVAAQPRHRVARAARALQPARDLDEQLIAGTVTERIVHHLEPVEVEEEDREPAAAAALRPLQRHPQPLHEQGAVGQPGERVVERRVPQLLLRAQALGHVDGDHQPRLPPGQLDGVGSHLHVEQLAGRLAVPPDVRQGRGTLRQPLQLVLQAGHVLGRADAGDGHAQELVARVPVTLDRRVVDGQEAQRLRVEHPHRLRARVEEHAVALLAGAQRVHHADPVGRVADRAPQRAPAAVLDGTRGHVDDDLAAVLAGVAGLVHPAHALLRLAQPRPVRLGLAPQVVQGHPQQLGTRISVELASVVVRVQHGLFVRVDDEDGVVRVFEERPVFALAAAQLVVGRLAPQDAPQLGADQSDDVDQSGRRRGPAVGEELQHREDALSQEDGERERGARAGRLVAVAGRLRQCGPQRAALREHLRSEAGLGRVAPRLRQRAVARQPLGILEMPEGAARKIARVLREVQPARLPAGMPADARERGAQRVLDRGRFVGNLGDRLQQLHLGGRRVCRRQLGQPIGRCPVHPPSSNLRVLSA